MEEISKFVNDVYVGMLSEDFSLSISCELASALGMFGPDIPELDERTGLLSACPDSMVIDYCVQIQLLVLLKLKFYRCRIIMC